MPLKLPKIFGENAYAAVNAVFPEIDANALRRSLDLEKRGLTNGRAGLPTATSAKDASLDAVELEVVDRMNSLRDQGLQSYEEYCRVYQRRVEEAPAVTGELRTAARCAQGDFEVEVTAMRGAMAAPLEALEGWSRELHAFRDRHGLRRPAYPSMTWAGTGTVLLLVILVESVLNGVLFAGRNELGLLGGALTAFVVSLVNIGVCSFLGMWARILWHRNVVVKVIGFGLIVAFAAFAAGYNLSVAHFRDAVETQTDWSAASRSALDTLVLTPLALESIESWLLAGFGALLSLMAFYKMVRAGEPYPNYGRLSRSYDTALADYADQLGDALEMLKAHRDDALEDLKESGEEARRAIADAVYAVQGQSNLAGHLTAFLRQCDDKTTMLLTVYRDANAAARGDAGPKRFTKPYKFAPFVAQSVPDTSIERARTQIGELDELLGAAGKAIHDAFLDLKASYRDVDEAMGRAGLTTRGPASKLQDATAHRPQLVVKDRARSTGPEAA